MAEHIDRQWQKQQYNGLNRRLVAYVEQVRDIFKRLNDEACLIAERTGYDAETEKPFSFKDYPQTLAAVNRLKEQYVKDIRANIMVNTSNEWRRSNAAQDALANGLFEKARHQIDGSRRTVLFQSNPAALEAFQNRKISKAGTISQNLWKQSGEHLNSLETAIGTAIKRGTSAITLSKQVSKYLQDFDKLRRDYKDTYGKAASIEDCEYRAARLARSEINMAYRTAEQQRWQQMDFVLGYEIQLSKTHKDVDICDDLCGRYPKDFVWTGWHPNDKCYAVPILMDTDDFARQMNGEPTNAKPITDVPDQFKQWVKDNADKLQSAKSVPYFVKDNKAVIRELLPKNKTISAQPTVKPNEKLGAVGTKEGNDSPKETYKFADLPISSEQLENFAVIENTLGIKRGEPMTIEEADRNNTNPNYSRGIEFKQNCQVCAPVYMLRLQGFNVKATGHYDKGSAFYLGDHCFEAWLNKDGSPVKISSAKDWLAKAPDEGYDLRDGVVNKKMYNKRWKDFINQETKEPGVYAIGVDWKENKDGHITIIHRFKDGKLSLVDPQFYNNIRNEYQIDLEDIYIRATRTPGDGDGIVRIDDKLFNTKFIDIIDIH